MRFLDIVLYIDSEGETARYSNIGENKVVIKGDIIKVLSAERSDYELNLRDAILFVTKKDSY